MRVQKTGSLLTLLALECSLAPSKAAASEPIDWGPWRVEIRRPDGALAARWLGGGRMPGIALWRNASSPEDGLEEFAARWDSPTDEGKGVVGYFDHAFRGDEQPEVASFGRTGNEITLAIAVHPAAVDSTRLDAKSADAPDHRTVRPFDAGGTAFFAAPLPLDLPVGTYRVVVELRDVAGKPLEHHERRFIRTEPKADAIARLDDAELLREYRRRGEALAGSAIGPSNTRRGFGLQMSAYLKPEYFPWTDVRMEILRRGARMVPALMTLLESESVRTPTPPGKEEELFVAGFAVDSMELLERIGDPRPLPLLIRIMKGMDGLANDTIRRKAADTAERLTGGAFELPRRADFSAKPPELALLADRYRVWLDGEGRDSSTWPSLAIAKARRAIERGDSDPATIEAALRLLVDRDEVGTGEHAAEDMALIAKLMANDANQALEVRYGPLATQLARYGPAARAYVPLFIRRASERPGAAILNQLAMIGGEEAVGYLVGVLADLRAKLAAFDVPPDSLYEEVTSNDARQALLAYQACRFGIERWAGRGFATDDAIRMWWAAEGRKTQRQWLEDALPSTAAEADAGDAKTQNILRGMLPDLPNRYADRPFRTPTFYATWRQFREQDLKAFRVNWLATNRSKLRYDERRSCFVLADAGERAQ